MVRKRQQRDRHWDEEMKPYQVTIETDKKTYQCSFKTFEEALLLYHVALNNNVKVSIKKRANNV